MSYEEYPTDHYVQPEIAASWGATYLCDIDGTLTFRSEAHDNDQYTRGIHDYHRVSEDWYNLEVVHTVGRLQLSGARIIFVSGRPESCRKDTEDWINADTNILRTNAEHPLYMRTMGDRRPDTIVKRELFDKNIRPGGHYIAGVFDDRNRVVRMWREQLGLTVFHVADHDF